MRKIFAMAGAAILAVTTLVVPANAQGGMSASGSCGYREGQYGIMGLFPDQANNQGSTVPSLHYQIMWSGAPAPTAMGALVRLNDELESHVATVSWIAQSSGGMIAAAINANISPAAQGGGVNFATKQSIATNKGRAERTTARRAGAFTSPQVGGGLAEGEYTFYIYTGEIKSMPETVKDGPAGTRFFADEKGYLGMFGCSVANDD